MWEQPFSAILIFNYFCENSGIPSRNILSLLIIWPSNINKMAHPIKHRQNNRINAMNFHRAQKKKARPNNNLLYSLIAWPDEK
jgi:hypothetical protein